MISATLRNICKKTGKTYLFYSYFQTPTLVLHVHKISGSVTYKRKAICFNMWTKSCLFHQLWTIFSTKIMKNPSIFVTYFWNSFQFVLSRPVLLWPLFYNKNDSCFDVANKMLLILKRILFTPFSKFSFIYHLLFQISEISTKHYNAPGKLCYWTLFLEDYATWKWIFFIFTYSVFSILDDFPKKT